MFYLGRIFADLFGSQPHTQSPPQSVCRHYASLNTDKPTQCQSINKEQSEYQYVLFVSIGTLFFSRIGTQGNHGQKISKSGTSLYHGNTLVARVITGFKSVSGLDKIILGIYSGPCDLRPLYLTIPCILRPDISGTTCIFSV